jgi:hypothetical protein
MLVCGSCPIQDRAYLYWRHQDRPRYSPQAIPPRYYRPLPSSSRLVLTTPVDDVKLVAIGYKYNRRKVLFFVATSGVADILNGDPYVQRWADDHGNLCTRNVPRPVLISRYFKDSPKVDKHNQARQHDLGLEELWGTQDC